MKKLLLTLMIGMFLVSLASASLGTFKQGDCVSLYQYCDDCTYVNLTTVQYPNGTIETINEAMTKNDVDYNYTFCNTNDLGKYYYVVKGDAGGTTATERLIFEITPNGKILEISESIVYILLSLFIFALFGFFLYLGIKTKWVNFTNTQGFIIKINKGKYLKLLYLWFSCGFFMWSIQMITSITNNYIELETTRNFITRIFLYSGRLSMGITMLFLILFFVFLWKDIVLSKEIQSYGKSLVRELN